MAEAGKKDEARKLLQEIYGWFTEGFDTARPERGKGTTRKTIVKGALPVRREAVEALGVLTHEKTLIPF